MRILILSFYYPPDLCAGSFRVKALEQALCNMADENLYIDIITTMPNRYNSFAVDVDEVEKTQNTSITRVNLPSHKSGMLDQSLAFATYAKKVLHETNNKEWDVVVATSSRLMTAVLGQKIATKTKAHLYLDIRDLFTDTMADILNKNISTILMPVFRWLEKRTFLKADRINLVSEGFLSHAMAVSPKHDYRLFTNGIDEEFLKIDFTKQNKETSSLPLIVYAGNMGEGQGLHNILPKALKLLDGKVRFRLLGDGGKRNQLEDAFKKENISNVELLNPIPRKELFAQYQEADILFLHLNDYSAFHKVLPSKIFEYAATGKPILAGVAGYAADFLNKEVEGSQVFSPCDEVGMVHATNNILSLDSHFNRDEFCKKFARNTIMQKMAIDILQLGEG